MSAEDIFVTILLNVWFVLTAVTGVLLLLVMTAQAGVAAVRQRRSAARTGAGSARRRVSPPVVRHS